MTKQLEIDVLSLSAQDKLHLLHFLIDNLFSTDKNSAELKQDDSEQGWNTWDEQIAADSRAGKLDFLFEEARVAKENNQLREL